MITQESQEDRRAFLHLHSQSYMLSSACCATSPHALFFLLRRGRPRTSPQRCPPRSRWWSHGRCHAEHHRCAPAIMRERMTLLHHAGPASALLINCLQTKARTWAVCGAADPSLGPSLVGERSPAIAVISASSAYCTEVHSSIRRPARLEKSDTPQHHAGTREMLHAPYTHANFMAQLAMMLAQTARLSCTTLPDGLACVGRTRAHDEKQVAVPTSGCRFALQLCLVYLQGHLTSVLPLAGIWPARVPVPMGVLLPLVCSRSEPSPKPASRIRDIT